MNRLPAVAAVMAAACFGLAPLATTAATSPTPSPSLDTVLAAPPASDFNELTTSPLHGKFTAHGWATLSGSATAAAATEATLNRDGFVDGFGKTWTQASSGHALIEAVMAFTGGHGAQSALTGMESSDKSDSSYKSAITVAGINPAYGAHFVDSSNQVVEDFFAFAKGNDVFGVAFVSSKDDVLDAATKQAQSQYASAPNATIASSQWPENASSTSTAFALGGLFAALIAGALVIGLVVLVVALVLRGRRRGVAVAGAYAAPGAPYAGTAMASPAAGLQLSPDGHYWWDGQSWRDASESAPPGAQRSSDGSYWWDGTNWRPVPPAPQPPPA